MHRLVALPLGVVTILTAAVAQASVTVVPNANALLQGNSGQAGQFGNGTANEGWTFQEAFDSSQLSAIPNGAQITGVSYRLASANSTVTTDANFAQYNIQIGKSANTTNSLSTSFASNQGSDTITARSGSLVIPANTFSYNSSGPTNPFYTINFSTPYTYTGGTLLLTARWTPVTNAANPDISVDANGVSNLTNTVADFSPTSTTGQVGFFNAPVVQFVFTTVPEPTAAGLFAGVAVVLSKRWRRA